MGNLIFTRLIMKKYVESNLSRNESVVKKADFNCLYLLKTWLRGILFFWILFIPTIRAIIDTVYFLFYELAITDKRIIGKEGIISTYVLDAPLNKIQNVSVVQPFWVKYLTMVLSVSILRQKNSHIPESKIRITSKALL